MMKKILSYSILYIFLIIYIYSITFVGIPISSKIIFEAISILYCLKYFLNSGARLKKLYKQILGFLLILVLWDFVVCLFNGGNEFYFCEKVISAILSIFASQVIYDVFKKNAFDRNRSLLFIVIVILSESILALLMKLFPPIYNFMLSFLIFDFGGFDMVDIYDVGRFFGIGTAMFFGVLPSCTLGLMTTMYLFIIAESRMMKLFLLASWGIIFSISFLTARYSILIGVISIIYFLYQSNRRKLVKNLFILAGIALVLFVAYNLAEKYGNDLLLSWAFGNFKGDGEGDNTVYYLKDWWLNTKFKIGTLIVGDGHYVGLNGHGYYKNVDIGYFRQIYYGGVVCLVLNIVAHAKILFKSSKHILDKRYAVYMKFLLLGYLAILSKGDANLMSFFMLVAIISSEGAFEKMNKNLY